MARNFHDLTVSNIRHLTGDAVAVTFDVPENLKTAFSFTPGQYLTLRADIDGKDVRRSYSISSPFGADGLTVGIRKVEGGAFSTYANEQLVVGDKVSVMEPAGRFTGEKISGANYLLIAAGSGITPIISIAATVLEGDPTSEITVLYGNRQTESIMFREELEVLKDRFMGRFTLIHMLSREEQDVPLLNGRIDGAKVADLTNVGAIKPLAADSVFLCGPGGMIKDVNDALDKIGVPTGKVKSERFTPVKGYEKSKAPSVTANADEKGATVEVILDGSRKRFTVSSSEESVLDAADRQGLDLPYSCKGGMCCTCRCKVVEGSAKMAVNYSLEPWELEAGFTLACQTHATSEKLVLDFDAS